MRWFTNETTQSRMQWRKSSHGAHQRASLFGTLATRLVIYQTASPRPALRWVSFQGPRSDQKIVIFSNEL
jgi:hypothetical protein